jgi:HPt (histidine-containing phosphotransfer) domain-containing protein
MNQTVFDRDHLERQTFGDVELKREVLSLFLRQCERLYELMQDATPHERRDLCHTLKGSARAIGAFAVAEAVETLENANGDDIAVADMLLDVGREIGHASNAIRSGLV